MSKTDIAQLAILRADREWLRLHDMGKSRDYRAILDAEFAAVEQDGNPLYQKWVTSNFDNVCTGWVS